MRKPWLSRRHPTRGFKGGLRCGGRSGGQADLHMRRRRRSCSCTRFVGNTGETAVEMYASHILFRLLFFLPQGGVQSCSRPAGFSVTCGGFTQRPWLFDHKYPAARHNPRETDPVFASYNYGPPDRTFLQHVADSVKVSGNPVNPPADPFLFVPPTTSTS